MKVIPDTEKEIKVDVQSTERVKTGTQKVKVDKPNPNKSAGQPPVIQVEEDADVYEDKVIIVKGTRSDNDEILRLRAKYGDKKITALLNAFKDLPKTFDEATKMGVQVGMPTSALMQLKAF